VATPLTADQLVRALKAEGLVVHEVHGWRTHNRNHQGAWGPVNGSMTHHTASNGSGVVAYVYEGSMKLPGPLAHGVIDKAGEIWLTGNGRANHAGGGDARVLAAVVAENYGDLPPATHEHQGSSGAVDGNTHFYGWECVNRGDGQDPWPTKQYLAMVKANAAVLRAHQWGARSAIAHAEWSDQKSDPKGISMPKFRADIAACLKLPAGNWGGISTKTRLTLESLAAKVAALTKRVAVLEKQK
jgi:hypothetical protein